MTNKQLEIDFPEAEKRELLRHARLPSVETRDGKVSAKCLRAVLNCIVFHTKKDKAGWAWPSIETIAALTEYKTRQVNRAIDALKNHLGVLIVETRKNPMGTVCNHYLLFRPKLERIVEASYRSAIGADRSAIGADRCAIGADRCAIGADRCATNGTRTEGTEKEDYPIPEPEVPKSETVERGSTVLDLSDPSLGPRLEILRPRLSVVVDALPCEWNSERDGKPCSMMGSVFTPLREKHLPNTTTVLEWHRRQLSAPSPVYGATEADAIMAVAVAMYAARFPPAEVRKSRVAIFANVTAKRAFSPVLRYLPEAIAAVDLIRRSQIATAR
jgi:hypothetical protein